MTVIADPTKLKDLAKQLRKAGEQIEQVQKQAMNALRSSNWEDKERQRFEAELSRDLKAAAAIGRKLRDEYPKALDRKAKALEDSCAGRVRWLNRGQALTRWRVFRLRSGRGRLQRRASLAKPSPQPTPTQGTARRSFAEGSIGTRRSVPR